MISLKIHAPPLNWSSCIQSKPWIWRLTLFLFNNTYSFYHGAIKYLELVKIGHPNFLPIITGKHKDPEYGLRGTMEVSDMLHHYFCYALYYPETVLVLINDDKSLIYFDLPIFRLSHGVDSVKAPVVQTS